jgi:hypothetical protein
VAYECCDYDPPEWIKKRNVKAARKPHQCVECRAPILVGEPYEYTSGKWDGIHDVFHVCALCVELREWATISVPCFCWGYGNLHQDVRDMVQEVAPTVPGFFMEYGRRMVRIREERRRRSTAT